jgi:hypothetical protein
MLVPCEFIEKYNIITIPKTLATLSYCFCREAAVPLSSFPNKPLGRKRDKFPPQKQEAVGCCLQIEKGLFI